MPTRKDNTNVAPIYREPVFIPATEATLIKQKARPKINGLPVASGAIDIVSPEFDLLTGIRGIANMIKPLNLGNPIINSKQKITPKVIYRTPVYKGGNIKNNKFAFFTTDPNYATQYGKVNKYMFDSKNTVNAKYPMMGYDDVVKNDMFIFDHIGKNKHIDAIIGHDKITNEFPYNSKGVEILSLNTNKNITPIANTPTYYNFYNHLNKMKCGGRRKAQLGLDIREGGIAIPIANNMYYMSGRSHENGGIGIGPNNKNGLEVEGGEVIKVDGNNMKVYSSVPFLRGASPAQLVMGGANPDKVFKAQESFKDRNRINDDGTSYKNGGEEKIYQMPFAQRVQYNRTGRIYNAGYPVTPLRGGYATLRALGRFRSTLKDTWRLDKALDSVVKGRLNDATGHTYKNPKNFVSAIKSIYNQFVGKSQERLGLLTEYTEPKDKKQFGGEDTRSRNLRKLRNKFNAKGEYTGGQFGGSGAGSVIYNTPEYVTDTITKRYLVPTQQTFNDAFRQARQSGLDTFMFDDKVYNTKLGDNPNSRKAGMRTQAIIVPIERKEVRRRKKEFGGMVYTINGNVKNGLGSLRPKAKYGTIDRKDKDVKVGPDGLIYRRDARGKWWTDGTKHITAKPIRKNSRRDLYYANPTEGLYRKTDSSNDFIGVSSRVPEKYTKITRDFGKPKRTYLSTMDDEEKETKKIGSLIYEKDSNGRWVPSKNQSTTTTRDGGRPKDFGITRTGINHPNGIYKYHPLTGERIEEVVEESKETKSSKTSTPRKGGSRAATSTKAATKPSFTTGEKPVTPTNPNEARYASRVQKGNAQEDVKPAAKPQQTDNMTADQARYSRAAGFNKNADTTTSSTGGGQQSSASKTDERWIGQYKPIQTADWVGLGANVLGSIGSYFITQKALKNIPEPVKPMATPIVKLKTRYDIEPQLTESREGELVDRAAVARNTASSNTSLARQQRISNRARQERAGYYGQKENIETQLINQDRLNRQQQMARDVAAYNDYLNRVYASKRDVATQRASNINNLITGLTGSVTNMLSGIETRRMNNNTLRAIAAANPNVDARLIGGFDYYDVFGSNRRYDRHGNLIRG